MLFPTLDFALFFIIVTVILALCGRHWELRKIALVVASYVFYAQWNWRFCFLLAFSGAVSYAAGRAISGAGVSGLRGWLLGGAVGVQLAVLAVFKYYDFFIGSANAVLHSAGWGEPLPFVEILLPVGISFFTFHGISYVVDVYRGDVRVCRRFTDMLLYMSFFPQLVAGPIVRSSFFLPQLECPSPDPIPLGPALLLIASGLFKKVVIANYLATGLVDPVFADPANFPALDLLCAAYGYAVQIFCDFSAYTDIAIGLAMLLGFRFPQNFNQPYRSASLREFWRRWHITLSLWLRDYLYKPLGGSRAGPLRTRFNLFATMLLGGIWHGAAWKFVAWGALHGGGLVLERPWSQRLESTRGIARVASVLVVFHFVCFAWLFFRADSFDTVVLYLQSFAALKGGVAQLTPWTLGLLAAGLSLHFVPRDLPARIAMALRLTHLPDWASAALFGVCGVLIDAAGPAGVAPFIYFQF
jgi:D-alanyl-lipoteichoic acid acyltransferase DltB (MBOAT superfamily)